MQRSHSFIATPPGVTVKEQLVDRGMQQKEFAVRMGMSEKHISKLINGEVQLTIDTARRLEMVLGLPAQFWCNLETIYRENLLKVNEENTMETDIAIAQKFPYQEMAKYGWVEDTEQWTERVISLRKYFEIARLNLLQKTLLPAAIYRPYEDTERSVCAMAAWAQRAKLEARKVKTDTIAIAKLKQKIPQIREMTTQDFIKTSQKLAKSLADCGVAVVFLPQIKNTVSNSITFLDGNKIVLGMITEEKDSRESWRNLFHELGHIVYGHIQRPGELTKEDEISASAYAKEMLEGYLQ